MLNATTGSTRFFIATQSSDMENQVKNRVAIGIRKAKDVAKDEGKYEGDADIAATLNEFLVAEGVPEVSRGVVGHWGTGRTSPTIVQFLLLCKTLGKTPAEILGDAWGTPAATDDPDADLVARVRMLQAEDKAYIKGQVDALVHKVPMQIAYPARKKPTLKSEGRDVPHKVNPIKGKRTFAKSTKLEKVK